MSSPSILRDHAEQIWRAGVAAVDSEQLVLNAVRCDGDTLCIGGTSLDLSGTGRILVVGAGKAGAGMASGFEQALAATGPSLLDRMDGWVNVPADCVRPLQRITLHAGRPAGVNEPRQAGVDGTQEIIKRLGAIGPQDVCIVLLSGGGSALLPAPIRGVTLADKLRVTQLLMSAGANIQELNCVRRHLSELKGGGLVQRTRAGAIVALVISDVIGDPLDVIASGPTASDNTTAADAIAILKRFGNDVPVSVLTALNAIHGSDCAGFDQVSNHIIGNNAAALEACELAARDLGYSVVSLGSDVAGVADDVGIALAEHAVSVRDGDDAKPVCFLSGGEPTVQLCEQPGQGGRNQQLVLAALNRLGGDLNSIAILAGGTDGEDGPTDAAGGVVTQQTANAALEHGLVAADYLAANDAYSFLSATDSLFRTGPTHTNVMDIRVALVAG